jgi:hypothetical protein
LYRFYWKFRKAQYQDIELCKRTLPICIPESDNYSPSEPDEPAEENSEKQPSRLQRKRRNVWMKEYLMNLRIYLSISVLRENLFLIYSLVP